ncbi:MAG TPA: iron-containing redox enzyme family protein [Thermoplasmata archaeon]|nr:iron-containing redox enzyme family protein [Thermoplasmata archaeon]
MTKCPACLDEFARGDFTALATHLVTRADESDPDHVRWLNQNVTKERATAEAIRPKLEAIFARTGPVSEWIVARFVARFYGARPHPFVLALQHPSRATLLGYVVEHQHFLVQWVRSCAYIMARTDDRAVVLYELDNLSTEFGGEEEGRGPAHYELLLRMGEALGVPRDRVLSTPPLPSTRRGIEGWQRIASQEPWVEALAAMHALELIAHRDLRRRGATVGYFDPAILKGTEIPAAAQAFLREGYEADVGHSEAALALVDRHTERLGRVEEVQATALRSFDLFDDYLMARLERALEFER